MRTEFRDDPSGTFDRPPKRIFARPKRKALSGPIFQRWFETVATLRMALGRRIPTPGLVIRSVRAIQYAFQGYTDLPKDPARVDFEPLPFGLHFLLAFC